MSVIARRASAVLGYIPAGISQFVTLGTTRLARWYQGNGVMKYRVGAVLRLKQTNVVGYGIRPIAVVVAHEKRNGEDHYLLDVTTDADGDFFKWFRDGYVPEGVERTTAREMHFKWNVENHFSRATSTSPEVAYG